MRLLLRVAFTAGIVVMLISARPAALEAAVRDESARAEEFRAFSVGIGVDGPESTALRHAPEMVAEADTIWRAYGVRVVLLPARAREIARCAVRLTLQFDSARAPATGRVNRTRLGSIWFHDDGIPSQTITMDVDAISARVLEGGVNGRPLDNWPPALAALMTGRALGRVLAHEIGHYLLAFPAHSRAGLMRASFDGRQLAGWDRRGFQLDASVLPRLRARVARLASFPEPLVAADQPSAARPN
jgi:hypothetical protein